MINAKELRIGNNVKKRSSNELLTVDLDLLKKIQRMPTLYSGIPLTEEWMVKFGFTDGNKSSANECDRWGNWYKDEAFKLMQNKHGEFEADVYCQELFVKYVHQLQNLYFALTGEELTIKI